MTRWKDAKKRLCAKSGDQIQCQQVKRKLQEEHVFHLPQDNIFWFLCSWWVSARPKLCWGRNVWKLLGNSSFLFGAHNPCSKRILLAVVLVEEQIRMIAELIWGLLEDIVFMSVAQTGPSQQWPSAAEGLLRDRRSMLGPKLVKLQTLL